MKKPMSLQEFADQHPENYDLIKEVVKLYQENHNYYYITIDPTMCRVCDKELAEEEKKAVEPHHCNYCCEEHAKYRTYFMLAHVRKELGIPPRPEYFSII
jgi:hypothetical protein